MLQLNKFELSHCSNICDKTILFKFKYFLKNATKYGHPMFQNSFFFAGFFDSFLWFDICISKTSVISFCLSGGMLCSWQNFEIYAKNQENNNIEYKQSNIIHYF